MDFKEIILLMTIMAATTSQDFDPSTYRDLLEDGLLIKMADEVETSAYADTKCAQDISTWKKSLGSQWALEMIDAGGKFPSGILRGNLNSLGNYDECLRVDSSSIKDPIRGKYCPINLMLVNMVLHVEEAIVGLLTSDTNAQGPIQGLAKGYENYGLYLGTCIPHSCNTTHVISFVDSVFRALKENITRPLVTATESDCSSAVDPTEWTDADIAALVIFSIFALILVLSTGYDLYLKFYLKADRSVRCILTSFSLYTNTEKLVKINKSSSTLRCIHGIRVMSIFWIMVTHRYATVPPNIIFNQLDILTWGKKWHSAAIAGGSVAVDSFFVLSGLLLVYVFLKQHENKTSFNVGLFYLHRFLRLWPAMAAMIFFHVTLFKFIGDGPIWKNISVLNVDICKETWWASLLYIQNYFNNQCIPHLWYFAIDTQLYLVSPILLVPLWKWKKFGIINLAFWIMVSQITLITIVYTNNWGAVFPIGDPTYNLQYYNGTHTRAPVWLLGFAAGYMLYETRNHKFKMNKIFVTAVWVACLAAMSATVFGTINLYPVFHEATKLEDGTYNAFARTGWALCLIWIIFACINGYGGPVNWFLSLRFWEILARMSYSMYIVHPMILAWYSGSTRTAIYFGDYNMFYIFFGDLVFISALSYLWTMTFESPFLAIEKAVFHKDIAIAAMPEINESLPQDLVAEMQEVERPEEVAMPAQDKMAAGVEIPIEVEITKNQF